MSFRENEAGATAHNEVVGQLVGADVKTVVGSHTHNKELTTHLHKEEDGNTIISKQELLVDPHTGNHLVLTQYEMVQFRIDAVVDVSKLAVTDEHSDFHVRVRSCRPNHIETESNEVLTDKTLKHLPSPDDCPLAGASRDVQIPPTRDELEIGFGRSIDCTE